jgi:hypothetical protein
MPKLIDKIEPVVLRALDRHCKPNYSSSYRSIIASFNRVNNYKELTIDEVQTLVCFLPEELRPKLGSCDFFYGDNVLQKKYQL